MDDIDYQAVAQALQAENERLRLHILKMRHARSPFEKVTVRNIKSWVEDNYMVIAGASLLFSIVFSLIEKLSETLSSNKE